jgi:hypothetical protein
MLRRAFDRFDELTAGELHYRGAIDHERNQQLTVRSELVEGLNQSFPKVVGDLFYG